MAMEMLKSKLYEIELKKEDKENKKTRSEKGEISWGNQIRSYVMQPYTMVKDHRTNTEISDVSSVLDGNIEKFLESQLTKFFLRKLGDIVENFLNMVFNFHFFHLLTRQRFSSKRKVDLSIPMYFFPYMDFSTQTPNISQTFPFSSKPALLQGYVFE